MDRGAWRAPVQIVCKSRNNWSNLACTHGLFQRDTALSARESYFFFPMPNFLSIINHILGDLPDPESEPMSLGSPALAGGLFFFFFNTKPLVNYIKTIANMQSSLCPNHLLHLTVPYVLEVFTSVVYTLVGNAIKWHRAMHFFPTPLSVTTHW